MVNKKGCTWPLAMHPNCKRKKTAINPNKNIIDFEKKSTIP
jgi:hypothetical protein